MTTFYLIRHAMNDYVGQALAGWLPDVHLNAEGREQAARLAKTLAGAGLTHIYSSPLERALETAVPLAEASGLAIETREELGEIRTGNWTGKTFAQLEADPEWRIYNQYRGGTRVPGGEMMIETQARMVGEIVRLRQAHPRGKVAIVSHADPIRAALAFFLGMPIDFYPRMEIQPASVSVVALEEWGPVITQMNAVA
ncbi:MAG TPA: histidine phosphatase family protein [Bryobacteraceae bacterium]|nr:histidine phosphatase family protein [Bryobacteraceae bacterium]